MAPTSSTNFTICNPSQMDRVQRSHSASTKMYQSQVAGIERIEANQKEVGSACDFRRLDGYLFHAPGTDEGILDREYAATCTVGMEVHRETGVPFEGQARTPSLRYPDQASGRETHGSAARRRRPHLSPSKWSSRSDERTSGRHMLPKLRQKPDML